MSKFRKLLNFKLFVIVAIVVAFVLRFIFLDRVPPGVGGDELTYIITSKFMTIWWSGIYHQWNPLSIFIFHYPHEFQAEITYFLLYPFLKFLPLSLTTVKSPFVILSVATVFLIYLVSNELFGKKVAVVASFVMAINPWSIFIGRTAYEMVPEAFFELLAIYVLLKVKGWKILWSIPILALVFYSHIAVKIIFVPLVVAILVYVYFQNKRKYLKQYLIIGIFATALTLFFAISIKTNPNFPRTSELLTPGSSQIATIVNQERKATISNPLSHIVDNKLTVFSEIIVNKLFNTLSFNYLFSTGDSFYGLYNHGLFYVVDFFFLLVGVVGAFIKKRKEFYFLIALGFIGVIPHLLHTASLDNFTPQITLLITIFIIFIAFGINNFSEIFKNKILIIVISIIYFISLLNFINIYFYQFPLREASDFKNRVLSSYIERMSKDNVIIYTPRSEVNFKKYLFYTNSINKKTVIFVSKDIKDRNYNLGKVTFTDCNMPKISKNITTIIDNECKNYKLKENYIKISKLSDGGADYRVFNDSVCSKFKLQHYASNITLSDFSVEKLSNEEFCKTYITK